MTTAATAVRTAISVSGLVKSFGRTRALDGLELTVRGGEVHGFLGPNGAGKTTTIRVLLGPLRADTSQLDAALRRLSDHGIRSLVSRPPTLEELFLRHYGSGETTAVATAGDGQGTRPRASR